MAPAVVVHQQVESEIFDEKARLVLQALLVERVQDRVASAIRRRARSIGHVALGVLGGVPPEPALVDLAGLRAAERHAQVLELDDRIDRLPAHIRDGVLVSEPVGASDGIEHVPAPVVVLDIAERRADSALRRDCVAARGKDFCDAGRVQAGRNHSEGRPQSGAAGPEDDHVEGVIDDVVAVGHDWAPIGRGRA